MKLAIRSILAAVAVTIAAQSAPAREAPQTLTFGIVPQQSASRLAKMWAPLLQHLGEQNDVRIEFRTTEDIPTFEACLAAGAFDIAYMNPMHYAVFADSVGYTAIARQKDKMLRGRLVVRADSGIESLQDLNGSEIAFPSPGAFGASIVPRAEISGEGVEFTPKYVKSHDSVYRAVVAGLVPAGGGVLRTFNAADDRIKEQLRVIYETDRYTPHAIAGHPDVPAVLLERLQDTFLEVSQNQPDLAASVGMNGFMAAQDADWDDVRSLELTNEQIGIATADAGTCPFD